MKLKLNYICQIWITALIIILAGTMLFFIYRVWELFTILGL